MANELAGKAIAFLVANEGVEQVELERPWEAVRAAGGEPHLIAPATGGVQAFNHLDKAEVFQADRTTSEATPADYAGMLLPGGVANPDALRLDAPAVAFVAEVFRLGRPVAAICHAPWMLVEAGVVGGRTLTSWPSLQTDIRNAGGTWVDAEVQRCTSGSNVLVTSRKPADLDAFCATVVEVLAAAPAAA